MIISIKAIKINPPSKIGIGIKFIIKREMLITLIKLKRLTNPVLAPSEKPSFTVVPSISVTLTGPETALSISIPLKSMPMLLIVNAVFFIASIKPCPIEAKKPYLGASFCKTCDVSAATPIFPLPLDLSSSI